MAVEKLIVDHIDTDHGAANPLHGGAAARVRLTCTALEAARANSGAGGARQAGAAGSERRTGVGTSGAYCGGKGQADEAREN